MAAAGKHYDLMSLEDIQAMPVKAITKKKSACFIWATSPLLHYAIETMTAWGFHFRGVAFVWVKTRKDGGIIDGQGVRPTFVKPNAEFLLAGSSTRTGRPLPLHTEAMGQVVLHPRLAHSEKPQVFHEKLDELFGDVSKIELFARRRYPGWDASGLELDGTRYDNAALLSL